MMNSLKRMVLTGAAVTVMMSFAAPAMAEGEAQQFQSDNFICDLFPSVCEPPVKPPEPVVEPVRDPVVGPVNDPVVEPVRDPGHICDVLSPGCKPPSGVADPGTVVDPVTDPPGKDPVTDPGKTDPGKDESDTRGSGGSSSGNSGGISSGSATGSSSDGSVSSASETFDRGGTFVSSFLPTTLTSTMGEAGNSVKKNFPAPVAKSLPNTGGGWSVLVLAAIALLAGGFVLRSIMRRTTSVTRTAQQ